MTTTPLLSAGAKWRRWDPHIHTPGTLLNDQFDGGWDAYIDELEKRTPAVEVVGITDYFCLENYLKVVEYKKAGRLPGVSLIFPNIELRLNIETKAKKAINLHLLFSPEDPDHVNMIRRAMQDLKFESREVDHSCTRDDLIRLGRSRLGSSCDEIAALREGANQFKVSFRDVLRAYRGNPWMKNNCLIAVSGSSNDGTAGLQGDDGWSESREEIERNAHIILIATESDRLYWLGKKDGFDKDHIETKYGSLKPCIHGSDAHRVDQVLEPAKSRYCWIKGDPTFEALRQVVLEPEVRVHIGETPPVRNDTGDWIKRVKTNNTDWLEQNDIELNDGLIAIIGARGSGKTALADIIARAARVDQAGENEKSFLHRAAEHLKEASVEMAWDAGEPSVESLWTDLRRSEYESSFDSGDGARLDSVDRAPIRYLSQQFVERLCSSTGLHSELVDEIERVIFDSIRRDDRMDCDSFESLVSLRVDPIHQTRADLQATIKGISSQIVVENEMIDNLAKYAKAVTDAERAIKKTQREMDALVPKGNKERAEELASISAAHTELSTTVERERRRLQRCSALRQEATNVTTIQAPQRLAELKQSFHDLDLTESDWSNFLLKFTGDVYAVLKAREAQIQERIEELNKSDPSRSEEYKKLPANKLPLEQLASQKLALERLVGIDKTNLAKYEGLKARVEQESRAHERAKDTYERAKGAQQRRDELTQRRRDHYRQCFQTFVDESAAREDLYGLLHESFKKGTGTINRLRFSVTRKVDLESWLKQSELLDFRMESELRGHVRFREAVKDQLYHAWQTGTAQEVSAAMAKFIATNFKQMERLKSPKIQTPANVAQWKQNVAAWLYSTDHITLTYSMTYEDVPIERLSPGTRGILLLMLYLVIDKHDKRPLLIDQPEENLDPRSVYQELVLHFREARKRRQVIIVTHNANLVVNTDADQVIVASATPNPDGGLPIIRYESGCLEDKAIRTAVCDILEGGKRAFLDREKRYRLQRDTNEMIA